MIGMVERSNVSKVARGSEAYPEPLERLSDPPESLYVRGRMPRLPGVAIVGARNADAMACRFTSQMAGRLAAEGITVVSGGALGIDTAAHRGALEACGSTVSVIGSGFDYLYPKDNHELFDAIAKTGALITEYPHEQPPTKWTFPKRNRVVAALSAAVLVVQAGERSGALITARLAGDLGIPVGAVPGVAGDPKNKGNHNLIRRGAALVENERDVLALMSSQGKKGQLPLPGLDFQPNRVSAATAEAYSPAEVKILDILCARPIHIDEITASSGLMPSETSAAILALELRGLVEDQGGKNFVKVG
jgi:DNA processing protein